MKSIVFDLETFYDDALNLKKMTTQEYITHPEFEVIGVGVQWADKAEPYWATDHHVAAVMSTIREDQDNTVLIAHNAAFDGAIASWHYGVRPAFLVDTISMARVLGLQSTVGGSLAKLAEQMQKAGIKVPDKGDEVVKAMGKHRRDFNDAELRAYGVYCMDDCRIARTLYNELLTLMPVDELMWQSTVLKMYTEPMLRVNHNTVHSELQRVRERREAAKHRLAHALGVTDLNALVSVLNSNPKFAEALTLFGAEVPMKISDATGKPTFALGIKDVGFMALQEHPVPEVRELVVARMGLKSSIEESRCEQFLKLAEFAAMPAPYKLSGARSHRLGGSDSNNLQNLPSGRVKGQSKALRESIEAPEGHILVGSDSSSIEVRCLAYIANAAQTIDNFRTGICPYSALASELFGGDPVQIKADAKKGIEPAAKHRQIAKSLVLGCGYSLGHAKFVDYAKLTAGIALSVDESKLYVGGYRKSNTAVVQSWRQGDQVLAAMVRGESGRFGGPSGNLFFFDGNRHVLGRHIPGVQLPDGCWISYPELGLTEGKFGVSYSFVEMVGRKREVNYIYGGKLIQNITQGFAFSVMKYYATVIDYKIVLNSHDEHVLCVPIAQADAAEAELESLMKTAPPWAPGLPLDCEVHRGFNYGELK